eukprot:CCRYP_001031-RB/>CCRYP_001031-RB protein AED:0.03 eAED:0.03 QI:172/1/1/1/1/1/4/560/1058
MNSNDEKGKDNNHNTKTHHQQRRSSTRPKLPPERFVARPSRRGLGALEGDVVFLSMFGAADSSSSSVVGDVVVRDGTTAVVEGGADVDLGVKVADVSRGEGEGRMAGKRRWDRGEVLGDDRKEEEEEGEVLDRGDGTAAESSVAKDVTRNDTRNGNDKDSLLSQSKISETRGVESAATMPLEGSVAHHDEKMTKSADDTPNNDHDDDEKNNNNTWTCPCGLVLEATRRRCKCRRWKGGVRTLVNTPKNRKTSKKVTVPRSSPPAAAAAQAVATCKAFQCTREPWGEEGFCRLHYETVVKSNNCADGVGTDITWTCDCGKEMKGDVRRCGECLSMRDVILSRAMEAAVQAKEEEKPEMEKRPKVMEVDVESEIPPESNDLSLNVASAHEPQDELKNQSDEKQARQQDNSATKNPNQCQIEGCEKFKQFQCDGLCWKHYRQRTVKFDNVEEANDLKIASRPINQRSRRKSTGGILSSNKNEAPSLAGRASTPSRKSRSSTINGRFHRKGIPTDEDATTNGWDASLRRSGRSLTRSPNARYVEDRDLDAESTDDERSAKKRESGKKRTIDTVNVINLIEKDKNLCMFDGCRRFRRRDGYCANHTPQANPSSLQDSTREVCKFEGCHKYSQANCDGCCEDHFSTSERERRSRGSRKVSLKGHLQNVCNTLEDDDAGSVMDHCPIIEDTTTTPSSESIVVSSARTRKNLEASPTAKSRAKKKPKTSESKVSSEVNQHEKATYVRFEEGEMVLVEPGACPARVMKVHSNVTSGNCTYDIVNILGRREQGVDEKRLSRYSSDDIFQSLSPDAGTSDLRFNTNAASKKVMLALTRYQLLSGQDCWICTTCSVGVPSLTMPCGVCKRHPTFVPLEMREFEEFVRCQRRKRNRLWLREVDGKISSNSSSSPAFESSAIAPDLSHLCKFQGCVQRGQTSNEGYCECHFNCIHLVKEHDRPLIDDYMYHLFNQLIPCILTEGDKIGFYRERDLGQPGITCKHCEGQRDGSSTKGGRSFPKDESSLRPPSFLRAFSKHLKSCDKCPKEIKERLALLEAAKSDVDDGKVNRY